MLDCYCCAAPTLKPGWSRDISFVPPLAHGIDRVPIKLHGKFV